MTSNDRLTAAYFRHYPVEFSRVVETASPPEVAELLGTMAPDQAALCCERLEPGFCGETLSHLGEEAFGRLVEAMDAARVALALSRLTNETRKRLLGRLSEPARKAIEDCLDYPADSAGALMSTRVLSFREETTVEAALERLRPMASTATQEIFLVDDDGILIGNVTWKQLALAAPTTRLADLISGVEGSVGAIEPREEIIRLMEEKKMSCIPVVDFDRRLLGMIQYRTLINTAQEEALEDLGAMVGVSPEERALSPAFFAVRKRLPWLQINLITAFLAAAVVGLFENTIAQVTALAVLLPVVAGQSGNTGAQALAVTLRGLTLKEIRISHWRRLVRKELTAGFLNGLAVAAVTGIGTFIWSGSIGLVLVIALSMVLSMMIASVAGMAVPVALKALKMDPAQSSSIILTTVTDIVGFFSFLGFATLFISMLPQGAV